MKVRGKCGAMKLIASSGIKTGSFSSFVPGGCRLEEAGDEGVEVSSAVTLLAPSICFG